MTSQRSGAHSGADRAYRGLDSERRAARQQPPGVAGGADVFGACSRDAARARRVVSGSLTLDRPLVLDGLMPRTVPRRTVDADHGISSQGAMQPLLWLHDYNERFQHPFLLRKPLQLPAGTVIRGVPPGAVVDLIPASGR